LSSGRELAASVLLKLACAARVRASLEPSVWATASLAKA
jgi:hypothetical protein